MFFLPIVTLFSFFIKGLCGFANSMVFTTLMSFKSSLVNISPVILLLDFPSNLIMTWNYRKEINFKVCLPLCMMVVAGMIPGTLFLKNADTGFLKVIFGVVVVSIAADMLLDMTLRRQKATSNKRSGGIKTSALGMLAGFVCGLCGIGVLIGAYVSKVTDSARAFKTNACAVFFVSNLTKIILFLMLDILSPDILFQAVRLIPFLLLGLWLGMRSSDFMNETLAKKLVLLLLVISGAVLVIENL